MKLLDFPEEIIEGCILPYLGWNDLLRFRRACKETHRITTRHMRVHPELAPEIEINEEDKSFAAFLKMDIPTTKLFLNNVSGDKFYQKEEETMMGFLEKYGPLVTTLRVRKISLLLCGLELVFPHFLPNLRNYEAGSYAMGTEQQRLNLVKHPATLTGGYAFPERFYHLESIKIGQDFVVEYIMHRTSTYLDECQEEIKRVSLPFSAYINIEALKVVYGPMVLDLDRRNCLGFMFTAVSSHITTRKEKYPGHPNFTAFDFTCYIEEPVPPVPGLVGMGSNAFARLCRVCHDNGVKLENVNAFWFLARTHAPQLAFPEMGAPVVSLVNLHPCIISLELPNMKRLEIRKTSMSRMPAEREWRGGRTNWPALESLDINVNTASTLAPSIGPTRTSMTVAEFKTTDIFGFCFKGIRRLALTELRLNFVQVDGGVPVPKTEEIVDSCPNLKKLTLVNWLGTNKALVKLWEGLRGLEEISLEHCKNLGNVAFVGADTNNPVFFRLKNLKKLSIKGLDKMPKISDLLFSLVLRYLSLSHLILSSDEPVQSVTPTGIRSLLDGKFAASIEKFPFSGWSMEGVSLEDFKKLETEFRSYEMI